MDFLTLISAFGVGSVTTAIIQSVLHSRSTSGRRLYEERKSAYVGLAEAWLKQEQDGITEQNSLEVGHWVFRCETVCPDSMLPLLDAWVTTVPGSDERQGATKKLKSAMRDDLTKFK